MTETLYSLDGWDITKAAEADWVPWGDKNDGTRAKVLGNADGYLAVLVEAAPGYTGTEHVHTNAEFQYVVSGELHTQGQTLTAGDAYAAAAGSRHQDFGTDSGATYFLVFKL